MKIFKGRDKKGRQVYHLPVSSFLGEVPISTSGTGGDMVHFKPQPQRKQEGCWGAILYSRGAVFLHRLEGSEGEIQHSSDCLMLILSLYVVPPSRMFLTL